MSLQVEKLEKNMAKLTIEVSAEELEKAIEGAYQKNKNKISIPGFRKGKAPRKMIEQMYGKSVFYEDAANALIPDAYDKALEECEEQIVSSPKIDVTQLEAGKPFIFTAEVALKPEVTLGKYKGVKVDKIDDKVSDEDIDAEINRESESNARTISVEDRADKDGVMTVINSIREIATHPVTGVTPSAQPVLGFNYGAKEYGRVKKAIVFTSFIAILYTTGIWLIVDGFPAFFIRIFNQDAELIAAGIPAIRLYFF